MGHDRQAVDAAGPDQLPPNRDLAYQIHSIRKMISASRQNVFDVDANEQHHADKAPGRSSLALAAAEAGRRQTDPQANRANV